MDKKPRLIDADALISYLRGRLMKEVYPDWEYIPSPTKNRICKLGEAFRDAIQQAPTIEAEPVRHSENVTPYSGDENILCKECGFTGEVYAHEYVCGIYVDAHGFACKHCPDCGAKMDGGKENDRE